MVHCATPVYVKYKKGHFGKRIERKAPKRCTFSPDDPKTSMELKLLNGNKNG